MHVEFSSIISGLCVCSSRAIKCLFEWYALQLYCISVIMLFVFVVLLFVGGRCVCVCCLFLYFPPFAEQDRVVRKGGRGVGSGATWRCTASTVAAASLYV